MNNHCFSVEHAGLYGVEEAVLIWHLQFWIRKNAANSEHQYDGRTWTYNSAKALATLFPYMTDRQLRRTVDSLESQDVVVKGNYNRSGMDRTLWLAFSDETIFLTLFHSPEKVSTFGKKHSPKTARPFAENGDSLIGTDINTDIAQAQFCSAWEKYPKRPGANRVAALKAWNARLKDGIDPDEMIHGVSRYAAYCTSKNTDGQYIKQPATFFGPDMHFRSEWEDESKPEFDQFAGAL